MAATGIAQAGGQEGTIGVGAEFQLNGLTGGPSLNYDAGAFHVGGFFSFEDLGGADNTDYSLGARFYYHVHTTAMSDFGIGGTLGLFSHDEPGGRQTDVFIEPGLQIRLFLAANVAISASAGFMIAAGDADGVAVRGQTIGAGIHYYFF